jgi:hypothetical protein
MKDCANYADLTFGGKAELYYAGGVVGSVLANEDKSKRWWQEISGLKNIANLTFTATSEAENPGYAFGGVVGMVEVTALATAKHDYIAINNCVVYGNLKADNMIKKAGMVMGAARDAGARVAKNCQIGGLLIWGKENVLIGTDAAGNEEYEILETPGNITIDNWFKHIYSEEVTEGIAKEDGCSLLTEKPAVPTVPAQ